MHKNNWGVQPVQQQKYLDMCLLAHFCFIHGSLSVCVNNVWCAWYIWCLYTRIRAFCGYMYFFSYHFMYRYWSISRRRIQPVHICSYNEFKWNFIIYLFEHNIITIHIYIYNMMQRRRAMHIVYIQSEWYEKKPWTNFGMNQKIIMHFCVSLCLYNFKSCFRIFCLWADWIYILFNIYRQWNEYTLRTE